MMNRVWRKNIATAAVAAAGDKSFAFRSPLRGLVLSKDYQSRGRFKKTEGFTSANPQLDDELNRKLRLKRMSGERQSSSLASAPDVAPHLCGPEWYDEYRRSIYGGLTHKALLVDAVGTLLVPSQPAAQIYRDIGLKYGVNYSEDEILSRYRWAYQQPWGNSRLRFVDDGRPFWQFIVQSATGCADSRYFEELYQYYTTDQAWHLCDPEAGKVFEALRRAGVKLAVVSNFDTRLRPLLQALKCEHWFDALAVSAEEMIVGMIFGAPEMPVATLGFGAEMSTPSKRLPKGLV